MRFVIVLAFLCCCYAAEQTTSESQQEGRQPPQLIKNFVEKHVENDKQQLPLAQQQATGGKFNEEIVKSTKNDQQLPENITKFIKNHITKILKYVAQHKQNVQSDSQPPLGLPPLIMQKIETVKGKVKDIIKQVETHIPQVINQQIAYKNKLKEQQQNKDKESDVRPVVPEHTKKAVEQIQKVHPHVPQDVQQHAAVIEKNEKDQTPVADIDKETVEQVPQANTEYIIVAVPSHFKDIVEKDHQLVEPANEQKADPNQNKDVEEYSVLKEQIQGIVEQNGQHVPQSLNQHTEHSDENTNQETPQLPLHIQGIVEKIHQHVPHVISQHVNKVESHNAKENSLVPGDIQGIVQQIHEHVPQVIEQHAEVVHNKVVKESSGLPANVLEIVQQTHQHVPQVVSQQIAQTEKHDAQKNPIVPSHIQAVDQESHTPIPQVIHNGEDNVADVILNKIAKETSVLPANVLGIVQLIHQHVPQVVTQQISHTNKHDVQERPIVTADIEDELDTELTNIVIPNQPIAHTINTQVVTSDIQSIDSHANVHPVVEIADKLTQHQVFRPDNIVPSRVQQIQNEFHISPARTT